MKKDFNFFIPVVLVLAVCFCLGMSGAPQQASTTEDELTKTAVEEAMANIEYTYASRHTSEMMDVLDKNFEDWLGFKSSIENHFLSVKELQIHFVVDSFLTEADKVSVSFHWFKKTIDNSGAFSKTEGRSQFVFHTTPGGLKLLYIRGDNPFF
jgi:hypothetical protein